MIRCENYFLLRVPLLPYRAASKALESDLKELFSQPLLKEAIFLATPTLYERLLLFLEDILPEDESRRVCLSLRKYLLRLSGRATPFGIFASVSTGRWAGSTTVCLSDSIRRCTRLDSNYVSVFVENLLKIPEVGNRVKFFPNNTVYSVGKKLRYIEYKKNINHKKLYYLSDIDCEPYLQTILKKAVNGANTPSLAKSITNEDIPYHEAMIFVEEIIENQLLTSELEITLTGKDYFSYVCDILQDLDFDLSILDEIKGYLKDIDQQPSKENLQTYPLLTQKLNQLSAVANFDHYIQTDAYRNGCIHIHERVSSVIERTTGLLSELMLPSFENGPIDNFRKRFFERYEFKTVDLCTALDPEVGIGYPITNRVELADSSLLRDICFHNERETPTVELSAFQNFLIDKYCEALQHQSDVILDTKELQAFLKPARLPASLYAFVSLYATSEKAVDEDDFYIHFTGAYGPSAVTLMARFCHLDNDLTNFIKGTLKKEEHQSEAVFAEIIHANQSRIGNISTRPVLSEYEIAILAISAVDEAHTIPINDLTLTIVGSRIVLRSRKLNREVIPRLSSAHNYSEDTVAAYRFLCDLQAQGVRSVIHWDWGVLKSAPYLPKVRMDKVILSPAQWRLSEKEILDIQSANDVSQVIQSIRLKRNLPPTVLVGNGDNKIPVDLENENYHAVFQKLIEDSPVLEEFVGCQDLLVKDGDNNNRYIHNLIVPLINTDIVKNSYVTPIVDAAHISRHFALGSEWLYYKIYCNEKAADQILLEVVKPLTEKLLLHGIIDKWFFIRYAAPLNHIRLRFHGQEAFYNTVIANFLQHIDPLMESGLISEIRTDTYRREVERYGNDNMVTSESLFFVDSQSTLELLERLKDKDDNLCWQFSLLEADQLLSTFTVSLEEKKNIMGDSKQQFFNEMKGNEDLKRSLASTLRKHRKTIENILWGDGVDELIKTIITRRAKRLQPLAKEILDKTQMKKLQIPLSELLKSYIHMSFNRLLKSNPRHHEMVLYDFLFQFYNSQLAVNRFREKS